MVFLPTVHDKELFAIFEAFQIWRHYLDGTVLPVDIITDHKNLEYFSTMKVLNCHQACWSEYLCQFNFIIRFWPGKLGAKLDALTRQWDVYAKDGGNDYAKVNPHNFRLVVTQDQLSASLHASSLIALALHGSLLMDTDQLHKDICNAYPFDPITAAQFPEPSDPKWTIWSTSPQQPNLCS